MTDAVEQFPLVTIEGDGVLLRPLTLDDVPEIVVAGADPLTQQWLPLPQPYTEDVARSFVLEFSEVQRTSGDGVVFGVEVDGRLARAIDLKHTDRRGGVTEIGYWTSPWARGRGVMRRAVVALSRWALLEQGMQRIEIYAADGNTGSQRVAEAAGFVREGVARNKGITHTGRVDLVAYSLVPADLTS